MNLAETNRYINDILCAFIGYEEPPKELDTLEKAKHLLRNAHTFIAKWSDAALTQILMEKEAELVAADPRILPVYLKAIGTLFPEHYSASPITHIGEANMSRWHGGCSEAAKMKILACRDKKLEILNLNFLKLTSLPKEVLRELPFVKHLAVSYNQIGLLTIPKEMVSLESIELCEDSEICAITFESGLPNLKKVDFSESHKLECIDMPFVMPQLTHVYIHTNSKLHTINFSKEQPPFERRVISNNFSDFSEV